MMNSTLFKQIIRYQIDDHCMGMRTIATSRKMQFCCSVNLVSLSVTHWIYLAALDPLP